MEHELSDEDRRLLAKTADSDVIVVEGIYDHVQDVLELANIRYQVVPQPRLGA